MSRLRARVTADGAMAPRAVIWAHNSASRGFFEAQGFAPVHTAYTLPLDE